MRWRAPRSGSRSPGRPSPPTDRGATGSTVAPPTVGPCRPCHVVSSRSRAPRWRCSRSRCPPAAGEADVDAFRGLGTWVDVYDYVPGFQSDGGPPPVTVDSIDDMSALGVRTLYLQSSQDDDRLQGQTVDKELLGTFLRRAHDNNIDVVAWYLPQFDDVDGDLRRIKALADFRTQGERFDGIALDVEYTQALARPRGAQRRAGRADGSRARDRRRPSPRCHRPRAAAPRRGEPELLARLPLEEDPRRLRRVAPDELLDEP